MSGARDHRRCQLVIDLAPQFDHCAARLALVSEVPDSLDCVGHSSAENVQERPGRDDPDAFVFPDCQEVRVTCHYERGAAGDRGREILVVVRVIAHTSHPNGSGDELGQNHQVFKPEGGIEVAAYRSPDLGILESPQDLLDHVLGQYQGEGTRAQKPFDDPARRTTGTDGCAHEAGQVDSRPEVGSRSGNRRRARQPIWRPRVGVPHSRACLLLASQGR